MPPTAPTPPSRRGLLLWGAAVATVAGSGALTGCDDLGVGLRPSPTSASARAEAAVIDEATVALDAALEQLRLTVRRHPGLRARLAPVVALHTAHRDALRRGHPGHRGTGPSTTPSGAPSGTSTPPRPTASAMAPRPTPVPAQSTAALAALASEERSLQARLTGLALDAPSGELARLLGSMAAATAQRRAVWPS